MIAHTVTDLTCWMVNCSSSQVYTKPFCYGHGFSDFAPAPDTESLAHGAYQMRDPPANDPKPGWAKSENPVRSLILQLHTFILLTE
jgi:hypothetical protein